MSLILDPINPLQTGVQTRDGRTARLLCTDRSAGNPIVALIKEGASENVQTYPMSGISNHDHSYDLINVPQKHEGWINVYPGPINVYPGPGSGLHNSKEKADGAAASHRIACIKVEFTEGEGL